MASKGVETHVPFHFLLAHNSRWSSIDGQFTDQNYTGRRSPTRISVIVFRYTSNLWRCVTCSELPYCTLHYCSRPKRAREYEGRKSGILARPKGVEQASQKVVSSTTIATRWRWRQGRPLVVQQRVSDGAIARISAAAKAERRQHVEEFENTKEVR